MTLHDTSDAAAIGVARIFERLPAGHALPAEVDKMIISGTRLEELTIAIIILQITGCANSHGRTQVVKTTRPSLSVRRDWAWAACA